MFCISWIYSNMLLFQFSCVNIVLLLLKSLQRSAKQEQYPNTPEYLFCSYAEHFVPLKWNKDPPWLWVVVSNPRVWLLQRKMCVLNNNDHTGQEYRNHHLEQDWVWSFFWLVQQGQLESMKMIGGVGGESGMRTIISHMDIVWVDLNADASLILGLFLG